jgi:hypothetical protein
MSFYPFGGTVSSDTAAMLIGGFMPMSPTAAPALPFKGDMVALRLTFVIRGVRG